jgi:hypothetical protein
MAAKLVAPTVELQTKQDPARLEIMDVVVINNSLASLLRTAASSTVISVVSYPPLTS